MNQPAPELNKNLCTGLIVMGHGSRLVEANDPLIDVARDIGERALYDFVQPAFLELADPRFPDAVSMLVSKGVTRITIMPYFLYTGMHLKRDLPKQLGEAREKFPDIDFVMAPNLGYHPSLVDITLERLREVEEPAGKKAIPFRQHPIEAESFDIIEDENDLSSISAERLDIVKRVIHATADSEYRDILNFSSGAVEAGIQAIREGGNVITDVKMVAAGVSKKRLSGFGGTVRSYISEKELPMESGLTRSAAAMRVAAPHMDRAVVAIGNAPTALLELIKLINEGKVKPALVIGVPVGFVGAAESKDELRLTSVDQISTLGRKGGSTVAAAIVNAIIIKSAAL